MLHCSLVLILLAASFFSSICALPPEDTYSTVRRDSAQLANITQLGAQIDLTFYQLIEQGFGLATSVFPGAKLIGVYARPSRGDSSTIAGDFTTLRLDLDDYSGDRIVIRVISPPPNLSWSTPMRIGGATYKYNDKMDVEAFYGDDLESTMSALSRKGYPGPWFCIFVYQPYLDTRHDPPQIYYRFVQNGVRILEYGTKDGKIYDVSATNLDAACVDVIQAGYSNSTAQTS